MSKHFVKVKEFIVDIMCIDESFTPVKEESKLGDDLGMDSLDHVELIMKIEKEFNVFILDKVAETLLTVKDITDFLDKEIK